MSAHSAMRSHVYIHHNLLCGVGHQRLDKQSRGMFYPRHTACTSTHEFERTRKIGWFALFLLLPKLFVLPVCLDC